MACLFLHFDVVGWEYAGTSSADTSPVSSKYGNEVWYNYLPPIVSALSFLRNTDDISLLEA